MQIGFVDSKSLFGARISALFRIIYLAGIIGLLGSKNFFSGPQPYSFPIDLPLSEFVPPTDDLVQKFPGYLPIFDLGLNLFAIVVEFWAGHLNFHQKVSVIFFGIEPQLNDGYLHSVPEPLQGGASLGGHPKVTCFQLRNMLRVFRIVGIGTIDEIFFDRIQH